MTNSTPLQTSFIQTLRDNTGAINTWLKNKEALGLLPFYSSVDIRNAGFKVASVDTNLFPAGFNNLCLTSDKHHSQVLKDTITQRVPHCKNILIIAEEHTRNKWYLENVHVLTQMIEDAGFKVTIASFLDPSDDICKDSKSLQLETANGHAITLHCLHAILSSVQSTPSPFDLIILNNDLTTGIPDILTQTNIPIYPSLNAGWHSRLKSHHFNVANTLISDFAQQFNIDPWQISCLFKTSDNRDINVESDRAALADLASDLFKEINEKYSTYEINEKPFIFLKSDKGTYGMGVHAIEDPADILSLNRKQRNKLKKGKSAQTIERFILQEGVPSFKEVDEQASEICIYQIAHHFAGGFYRLNNLKSGRDNLNSQGMSFKKICPPPNEDCEESIEEALDIYKIIARLSAIAAQREISELDAQNE